MKTDKEHQQFLIDEGYAEGKKSFAYLWDKIELSFNWDMVEQAMIANNWNWMFTTRRRVPSTNDLKTQARKMLLEVWENEKSVSTGGFTAGYDSGELFLIFILQECNTGDL